MTETNDKVQYSNIATSFPLLWFCIVIRRNPQIVTNTVDHYSYFVFLLKSTQPNPIIGKSVYLF